MRILLAYVIFLISLAILVSLSILYTQRYRELTHYTNQVENTHMVIIELNKLFGLLTDAETGSRGFLLSNDSAFLAPYYTAIDSIAPTYQRVIDLIPKKTPLAQKAQQLNVLFYDRLDMINHTMILYGGDRADFNAALTRGKLKMDECRNIVKQMNREAYSYLEESKKTKAFYEVVTPGFFLVIMGFTAIAFVLSFYVILKEYRGRLKYQKELEQKIIALDQSYKELEQITHVSSHDLQEPLRKISVFSDRLSMKYGGMLDAEGKLIVERIQHAAVRTKDLVELLSNYTSLITENISKKRIAIPLVIQHIKNKFYESNQRVDVFTDVDYTLHVYAQPEQLQLLFECLLDNSIKFRHRDRALTVSILEGPISDGELLNIQAHAGAARFKKIIYKDNGIGFDNQFAEKIFSIFQRLHTQQDFDGKGVGLAVVRRIMINHEGFVSAEGHPNDGAIFSLYFPDPGEG